MELYFSDQEFFQNYVLPLTEKISVNKKIILDLVNTLRLGQG